MSELKTILLVEDEVLIAMDEARMLRAEGYRVELAASGEQAIAKVQAAPCTVDLILMDINLGRGMDGTQAAQRILEKHDIPVVFLSSHTEPEVVEKTEKITSYGYVVKNSGITVLSASIKMAFKLHAAHQALQNSEKQYRSLFENMHSGFSLFEVILDREENPIDHCLLQANAEFETQTGLKCAEEIGRTSAGLSFKWPEAVARQYYEIAISGGTLHNEFFNEPLNRYYNVRVFSPYKGQFALLFHDITEQKLAEEALRKSQAQMQTLIENTPDMIVRFDQNYRHVFVNQAVTKETGKPVNFYIGKSHRELGTLPLKQIEFSENMIRQVFETRQEVSFETFIPLGQGMKYYLSKGTPEFAADGSVTSALFIHRDITEYKQASEALRKSEAKYRALISEMFVGFSLQEIVCDSAGRPIDYITLEVNKAFETYLNAPGEAVIGKKASEILPPEELAHWLGIFGPVALTGKPAHYKMYSPLNEKHFEGSVYCPEIGKFAVTFIEVTARDQAEAALRASQARFQGMIDAAPIPYALNDNQRHITYLNPAFIQTIGYTMQDIPTLTEWWQNAYPDLAYRAWVATTWQIRLEEAAQTGKPFEPMEVNIRCKNGEERIFVVSAAPLADDFGSVHVVIFYDITERKQAEQALVNSSEAFKGYFNMGTVGMCVTSPEKGWVEVNEHLCTMLGYTREELTRLNWAELTHPDDLNKDIILFNQVVTGQRDSYELDKRFIRKDGQVVYTTLYATCQRKPDGSVRHFLASLVDITARKQIEEALQRSAQEKETLMHELQHRVKNSLMVASSLLALEEENLADERARAIFASTQARIHSISAVYEQLYRTGGIDRVDLRQYIQKLVAGLAQAYTSQSRYIETEIEVEEIQLDLKRTLPLGLILNELITNAFKYAFPLGKTPSGDSPLVGVKLSQTAEMVTLCVSDNGVGKQNTSSHNEGMGLELVKLLVSQIDGEFAIQFGHGCTACVVFHRA